MMFKYLSTLYSLDIGIISEAKHLNRLLYSFELTKDLVNTTIWLEYYKYFHFQALTHMIKT